MRDWGVPVECLCDQHLRGMHVEMHMIAGILNKEEQAKKNGEKYRGYRSESFTKFTQHLEKGTTDVYTLTSYIAIHLVRQRHDEVAMEMERRGDTHRSLLPPFPERVEGVINTEGNLIELARRCPRCRERIHFYQMTLFS